MTAPVSDQRTSPRRTLDEQIASEAELSPPALPSDAAPLPMETHLRRIRRPIAVAGVVENGMVRLLDPGVKLPEHSRVIIVAAEGV